MDNRVIPSTKGPYIGTAGWTVVKELDFHFPPSGTHLERYAHQMNAVEINSSFYRNHRRSTYQRWEESTPDYFRFSVKMPRVITHQKRLINCKTELKEFIDGVEGLNEKLGVILVQLPPSLKWDSKISEEFFAALRAVYSGPIAFEPRQKSWFTEESTTLLLAYQISRVAADPSICEQGSYPSGDSSLSYFRWHGSPRIYYSNYEENRIQLLADQIRSNWMDRQSTVWCIFDNTAANAALANAVSLASNFVALPKT